MAVHVEEMTNEVAVLAGELPLSERQLDRLVELVAARLEARQGARTDEDRTLSSGAAPPINVEA
jgi:hypothetical protein